MRETEKEEDTYMHKYTRARTLEIKQSVVYFSP